MTIENFIEAYQIKKISHLAKVKALHKFGNLTIENFVKSIFTERDISRFSGITRQTIYDYKRGIKRGNRSSKQVMFIYDALKAMTIEKMIGEYAQKSIGGAE